MWIDVLTLTVGFGLIAYAADRFVDHAAALAQIMGIAPLVVGLTVVAVGSSAPELLVSCIAALDGNGGLAVGNAVGSNIANVGLVLGITAVAGGLTMPATIRRRELPVMLLVSFSVGALLLNGTLGRGEGALLILTFTTLLGALVYSQRRRHRAGPENRDPADLKPERSEALQALVWTLVHLGLLLAASRIVVVSAVDIAQLLGISSTIIGLTVVAFGTSLPEVAASLAAALKGHHDMAVGNVVGSNIANLLLVLGAAALVSPPQIEPAVLQRDLPVMLVMAIAILLVPRADGPPGSSASHQRLVGALLLGCYLTYLGAITLLATAR